VKKIIKPTILRGTRDFLPQQMACRNQVMDIIKSTFEQFGYASIETPILSPADTILGKYGEEGDQLAYSFTDRGGRRIALPYDLTVPFARYMAANYRELPIPFKRYQIQRVWRAERPQKGRLREFYQCDVDIIGSDSLLCEAEIAKIIVTVFDRLKISNVKIKINSRRLLNDILSFFGVLEDKVLPAIRLIDKLEKIGEDSVIDELNKIGVKNAREIIETLKPGNNNIITLNKLNKFNVDDINNFLGLSKQLSVPDENILIDPTLARGLDYYTGLVFEVIAPGSDLGAICAGGRYDNLCSLFSDQDFSGIGVAFGFERIMMLIEKDKLFDNSASNSKVLVTIFDNDQVYNALSVYNNLINVGIPAEIYMGTDKLAKQLKFADKKGIPFVVIQGPEEIEREEIIIRRMDTGLQKVLSKDQLVSYMRGYYEAK